MELYCIECVSYFDGKKLFLTLFSDFIWILISNLKNGETESVKNRVQRNGKKLGFQFSKNLIFHDFSQNWSVPNVTNFLGCNFFAAASWACLALFFSTLIKSLKMRQVEPNSVVKTKIRPCKDKEVCQYLTLKRLIYICFMSADENPNNIEWHW